MGDELIIYAKSSGGARYVHKPCMRITFEKDDNKFERNVLNYYKLRNMVCSRNHRWVEATLSLSGLWMEKRGIEDI
jgi:hypothetical protein